MIDLKYKRFIKTPNAKLDKAPKESLYILRDLLKQVPSIYGTNLVASAKAIKHLRSTNKPGWVIYESPFKLNFIFNFDVNSNLQLKIRVYWLNDWYTIAVKPVIDMEVHKNDTSYHLSFLFYTEVERAVFERIKEIDKLL